MCKVCGEVFEIRLDEVDVRVDGISTRFPRKERERVLAEFAKACPSQIASTFIGKKHMVLHYGNLVNVVRPADACTETAVRFFLHDLVSLTYHACLHSVSDAQLAKHAASVSAVYAA